MKFNFVAGSEENKTYVLEKDEGEYFRSLVADPDHPVHTTSRVSKAHTWDEKASAENFLRSNGLRRKGYTVKGL